MKRFTAIICFLLLSASALAQNQNGFPLSVGYLGHFGFQPGLKVSTEFSLMGRDLPNAPKQWFASPQVGIFTNPGDDTNYLINFEAGFKKNNTSKHRYRAFTAGLGYMAQSKLVAFAVNLGNGDTDSRERDTRHFALPTLSFEHGWATHKPLGWYIKYTVGSALGGERETSLTLFIEAGVKFKLGKQKAQNDD